MNGIPPFAERTDAGMRADMVNAQRHIRDFGVPRDFQEFHGHKGAAELLLMRNYDLRQGQAQDDLHQDHEGTAKHLSQLLLTEAPRVVVNMALADLERQIDAVLLTIKTPSRISRKPRPIAKLASFNGTECRNWLLFYAVPCLTGHIDNEYVNLIASLSYACYLLSQDVIELRDINEADRLLQDFARSFEEKFGVEKMKFNLHVTTSHKVTSIRMLGPSWSNSTYNFESLNSKVVKTVTSPKGAIMQIVTRCLLNQTVHNATYDENLPHEVRNRVQEILSKTRLTRVEQVGPSLYVTGRGVNRVPTAQEAQVLQREGHVIRNYREYKGFLKGSTRYKSVPAQNPDIRSDDTFIYSHQDTFCTILKVISFSDDNGERHGGIFVHEHDVARVLPVARHISVLANRDADLLHFIPLEQVRCPAIKINVGQIVYAVCVPNCFEID